VRWAHKGCVCVAAVGERRPSRHACDAGRAAALRLYRRRCIPAAGREDGAGCRCTHTPAVGGRPTRIATCLQHVVAARAHAGGAGVRSSPLDWDPRNTHAEYGPGPALSRLPRPCRSTELGPPRRVTVRPGAGPFAAAATLPVDRTRAASLSAARVGSSRQRRPGPRQPTSVSALGWLAAATALATWAAGDPGGSGSDYGPRPPRAPTIAPRPGDYAAGDPARRDGTLGPAFYLFKPKRCPRASG
jgi:hypothetical protein